jgi:hypothetical protein
MKKKSMNTIIRNTLAIGMTVVITASGFALPALAQTTQQTTAQATATYPHSFTNRGLTFNVTSDVHAIATMEAVERAIGNVSDQTFNQTLASRNSPSWRIVGIDETWNQMMVRTADGASQRISPLEVNGVSLTLL